MSVIVKGMEMPKGCGCCSMASHCESLLRKIEQTDDELWIPLNYRLDDCPLVEIPTPHGRLIDKDKLRHELFTNFNGERIPFYDCDNFPTTITYRDLHSILSEQKTIIEAEGKL